ncbi:hypothetical protein RB200_20305 [Streptomyces sp. PmtG]
MRGHLPARTTRASEDAEDEFEGPDRREEVHEPHLVERQVAVHAEGEQPGLVGHDVRGDEERQRDQADHRAERGPQPLLADAAQQGQQQGEGQVEEELAGQRPAHAVDGGGGLDVGEPRLLHGQGREPVDRARGPVGVDDEQRGQAEGDQVHGADLRQAAAPERPRGVAVPGGPGEDEAAQDEEEADAVGAREREGVPEFHSGVARYEPGVEDDVGGEDHQGRHEAQPCERRQPVGGQRWSRGPCGPRR